MIGGGDWTADQLIPDLMRAFLAGKPCLIRNPSAFRPWQFVLEPLRGYLMLAEKLSEEPAAFSSAWNFGPVDSDAKPVAWIADELVRAELVRIVLLLANRLHVGSPRPRRIDRDDKSVGCGHTPHIGHSAGQVKIRRAPDLWPSQGSAEAEYPPAYLRRQRV